MMKKYSNKAVKVEVFLFHDTELWIGIDFQTEEKIKEMLLQKTIIIFSDEKKADFL